MTAMTLSAAGVLVLGVWHGINPGMGWLFAVALGMQERSARAVWRALPPLALGHALAVANAVVAAALLGLVLPAAALKYVVAAALLGFGLWRLTRNGHPRFGGMQVGPRDLTIWSLLMATAHGAGLMVVPFVMGGAAAAAQDVAEGAGFDALGVHAHHGVATAAVLDGSSLGSALAATLLHTSGYLVVTGLIALLVYRWVGLRYLRRLWVNLDIIWGSALILTAVLTVAV
jgi:hypothetical protein